MVHRNIKPLIGPFVVQQPETRHTFKTVATQMKSNLGQSQIARSKHAAVVPEELRGPDGTVLFGAWCNKIGRCLQMPDWDKLASDAKTKLCVVDIDGIKNELDSAIGAIAEQGLKDKLAEFLVKPGEEPHEWNGGQVGKHVPMPSTGYR